MRVVCLLIVLFISPASFSFGAVKGEEVEYTSNGLKMKGYLAYDDATSDKRPGVLVVHEWWGNDEYSRNRARMLAELGYTAFALDMYGEGKTATHPDDARRLSSEVRQNMPAAENRFLAAMKVLQQHPTTDSDRIAAIGYCFGGAVVLHMARKGYDLDGVASFHGSYSTNTPAQPGKVKAAVLVAHGAADDFSTPEQVEALKKEMKEANVDFTFISYEGAKHSFTNPEADRHKDMGLAYNPEADKKSWSDLQAFLKRIFAR